MSDDPSSTDFKWLTLYTDACLGSTGNNCSPVTLLIPGGGPRINEFETRSTNVVIHTEFVPKNSPEGKSPDTSKPHDLPLAALVGGAIGIVFVLVGFVVYMTHRKGKIGGVTPKSTR